MVDDNTTALEKLKTKYGPNVLDDFLQNLGFIPKRAPFQVSVQPNTDTIPAKLTPGEAVLPTSVTQSPNPGQSAKEFMDGKPVQHFAEGTRKVEDTDTEDTEDAGADDEPEEQDSNAPAFDPTALSAQLQNSIPSQGGEVPAFDTAALSAQLQASLPSQGGEETPPPAKETAAPQEPQQKQEIDLGKATLGIPENLKKVQEEARNATLLNQLGKAAELAGSGIPAALGGGIVRPTQRTGEQLFNQNIALAQQNVKDFQTLTEQERKDPNSQYAEGLRTFMKNQFGMNVKGGTPEQIMGIAPLVVQAYDKKLQILNQRNIAEANRQSRETIAGMRLDAAKDKEQNRLDAQDEKIQAELSKRYNALNQSSRTPIGQAALSKVSIDRLLDIVNDPNATNQDLNSAAADLNRVVSNTVTQSGAEHQAYKTAQGDLAKILTYITGDPQAPVIPGIKKHIADVANRMNSISDKVINQYSGGVQAGYTKWIQRHPNEWKGILARGASLTPTNIPMTQTGFTQEISAPSSKLGLQPGQKFTGKDGKMYQVSDDGKQYNEIK